MNPQEAFEALAGIVTLATKRPFRAEPVTPEEWDTITDKVLQLAEKEKSNGNGSTQDARIQDAG